MFVGGNALAHLYKNPTEILAEDLIGGWFVSSELLLGVSGGMHLQGLS